MAVTNDELFNEIQEVKQSLAVVSRQLESLEHLPILDMQGDIQSLGDSLWRLQGAECAAGDQHEELEDAPAP